MPIKGEKMSEELKAKMAAGRAASREKKAKQTSEPQTKPSNPTPRVAPESPLEAPVPQEHSAQDPNVTELARMVLELKQQLEQSQAISNAFMAGAGQSGNNNSQVANGRLIGTTERYSVNKDHYEDPREKLRNEPRLKRIAFDSNYELDFTISTTSYETKDGINMKEPKFNLRLNQIVLTDDGEPTNRRIGKAQMIFFEDPETAIIIANENGLEVDEENQEKFLNDMRYIRIRDWLLECFWPARVDKVQSNKTEMVIGGQVVESWEISTEGSAKIPFGELNTKLRS